MSDRVVKPFDDANKKSKQTLWLAHWNQTSCDAARETIGPNSSGGEELEYATRNVEDLTEGLECSSRSVKGLNMIKAKTSETGYGIIKVSSKSIGNERMLGSLFKDGQDTNAKGKAALSAVSKPSRTTKRKLECEECYEDGHSADLVLERKMICHSQPDNSVKACLKKAITCDHCLSTYGCNRLAKMQKSSNFGLFQSRCISSEEFETKKSHNDRCYLLKLQNSVDGVETVRIHTTIDASEGMPEGCSASRFTLTTNGLLITKNTDINPFKENDMTFNLESNIRAWSNVASSREVGHQQQNNKIPHINIVPPHAATSSEDVRPSFSETLETDKLVEHAEQPSNFSLDDISNADPGERWVKRLKLSSSNPSAQGTNSSNFASSPSAQVKISKLFGGIPKRKSSTARSAPALEKTVVFGKSDEQILENQKNKGKEASVLSHAWVKRWLYIERETKSEAEVVCEPKVSLEKQLPSIAAMALMGKALAYLQPCEFQKMGSLTVWNTKACC